RAGAYAATTRSRSEPVTMLGLPPRRQLRDQAFNHLPGQPGHPTIRHDRSTNHGTIIDSQASTTVHEVVRDVS
ncbi:hypothetical protein, partial [Micromonospora sp. NPDC005206]|uniref:hypothetical protein n=1 Tax=Micromonospora sp. NPDC005206 TaxID=3157022 RepID=UPI0033B01EF2